MIPFTSLGVVITRFVAVVITGIIGWFGNTVPVIVQDHILWNFSLIFGDIGANIDRVIALISAVIIAITVVIGAKPVVGYHVAIMITMS